MPTWCDWVGIGIHLRYGNVTLTGNLLENGCNRSAWSAPRGPEIHQYPFVTASNHIKVCIGRIHYLSQRLTYFSRVITILSICVFTSRSTSAGIVNPGPIALRMEITPSILTADFARLGETLEEAVAAGINWIHMDVMDGNWVVNRTITFGPAIIRSVRDRLGPEVTIDCHLMITNAEATWKQYAEAGVDMVIAHIEAVEDFPTLITEMRQAGIGIGCVLNPDTPAEDVLPLLPELDLVLVMSVVPGKGGQSFMPEVEGKVRAFRAAIDEQKSNGGRAVKLMIDGGIKDHNAAMVAEWGIDIAVVGSGLINDRGSIAENLAAIHKALG